MAMLALKALSLGSEKIPDKAFHAVPYFRPEGEENPIRFGRSKSRKNKKKANRDGMHDDGNDTRNEQSQSRSRSARRHRHKSDDYSASESGSDTEGSARRRRPQRPSRRHRRYTSSKHLDRGYDSEGMTPDEYHQSRGVPPQPTPGPRSGGYFPPPPIQSHNYNDNPAYHQGQDPQYVNNGTDPMYGGGNRGPETFNAYPGPYHSQQGSPAPSHSRQPPFDPDAPRPTSAASSDWFHQNPTYTSSPQPQPQGNWEPKRSSVNPGYTPHAGYAEQYTAGYQPLQQQPYYPPQAGPYQGALAVQPPAPQSETGYSNALAPHVMPPPQSDTAMNGAYPTYVPPQDNWTGSRSPSPDRHRRHRHRSKSRGARSDSDDDRSRSRSRDRSRDRNRGRDEDRGSKSRNRSRSIAAQAKEALKSNRDVASSALGVVAGGLIGNQVGRGNRLGTLAGAVIGGFGANLWEKQHADKKERREKRGHDGQVEREVREIYEKRRLQKQQHDREKDDKSAARRERHRDERESRPRSPPSDQGHNVAYRERSRHPYARSYQPQYQPQQPSSPHVHFAKPDPKEFVRSATSKATVRDLDSRSERAATQSFTRDAATQTSSRKDATYDRDTRSLNQRKKDYVKDKIEKEIPGSKKVLKTAQAIKKAAKKGVWDGTTVEEVFMEMTGVSIGDEDLMRSDWKN